MPSKFRPLTFEETTKPPGFKLTELTDLQMKIISYLLRVKYAERLLDDSIPTRGQLVVSDEDPGSGVWTEVETWDGEPLSDTRRTHFLYDPVFDTDENNVFIESPYNASTDIQRVIAKNDQNIGMTTIQDEGEPDAQQGVSWPTTGFDDTGPNRTRSIGDNANTNFNVKYVRALRQSVETGGVIDDLKTVEFEDALAITAGEVGDSDPLVLQDSPHEFHYWQFDEFPEEPTAEDCDEYGYLYYDEAGYGAGPGLMAIGRQEEKVVSAIIDDCIKEMKTGDGIGTYYVEANSDGEPTDGTYEKIGTFFWDTRSNYTDPEAPLSSIETTVEIDVIEYYEMYLKTGEGDNFNLTNQFNQFENIVFLESSEPGAIKTIETEGDYSSEDAVQTKYSTINDLIELVLLPYLEMSDNLPIYKIYRSRPDRSKTRGRFKDTRYRRNIDYLDPEYASTYTYQRISIPDSTSSFYSLVRYLGIDN